MNTADFLIQNTQDKAVAIITKDGTYTYGDLKQAAARLAGELASLGIRPGDRVGLLSQNSLFWIAAYLAILKSGAIAAPFSPHITIKDLRRNVEFIDCKAAFLATRCQKKLGVAFQNRLPVITDKTLNQPGPSTWDETSANINLDQDATLMFTSGTTARPRAVRVTHRNIQANTNSIIQYLELNASERVLVILPFYYCFGTSLLHTHLRVGGSLALCNTFTFPETALDLMEATKCTGLAGVPSSFQLLLRNSTFIKRTTPTLRKIQQAGGKLHEILIQELAAAKPQAKVYVMYGQTEATARLSCLPPELLPTKLGSIGKGIPEVELRIVGKDGNPVKPGEVGEIIARGKNISPGYFKDPEASAGKFSAGELHTGDMATVDEDGYIYVVDRIADFIKTWGYRVSSQEVESCVLQLPDIVSAAAVGVPDITAGEAIHIFITLRARAAITPDAIIDHCRRKLAKYMVPKTVTIINSLPLNAHGKVLKGELRKMALDCADNLPSQNKNMRFQNRVKNTLAELSNN